MLPKPTNPSLTRRLRARTHRYPLDSDPAWCPVWLTVPRRVLTEPHVGTWGQPGLLRMNGW